MYDSATMGDKLMRYTFTFSKGREINNEKTNELSKRIHHIHQSIYTQEKMTGKGKTKFSSVRIMTYKSTVISVS